MAPSVLVAIIVCTSGLLAILLIGWMGRRELPPTFPIEQRRALYQRLLDKLVAADREPDRVRSRRDMDSAVHACILQAPPGVVEVVRRCREAIVRGGVLSADLEAELLATLRRDLELQPLSNPSTSTPGTPLDGGPVSRHDL